MSRKHQHQESIGALQSEIKRLQAELSKQRGKAISKDFIYFAISLLIPWGYGEMDLIPRASVWHVVFGWACWSIPIFLISRLLWLWLKSKQHGLLFRSVVALIISALFLEASHASIRSFIDRQLREEQEDVRKNLVSSVLPPITENVMESVFAVTNKSSRTTIASGMLFCGINQIVGDNHGTPVHIRQLSSSAIPNASRLIPGDSRSEPCLMMWSKLVQTAQCIDMNLWIRYVIEPQPQQRQEKWFRLIGIHSREGSFNWYPEPTDSTIDYCDYFRRQTAPP